MVSLKSKAADIAEADELAADGGDTHVGPLANDRSARQDWNALDLSSHGLRALSPLLFMYEFLTRLYLDDNRLQNLHPSIGQLRSLTHLDISNNGILELPEEIGMLVNLRECLAFDNRLRMLPSEIGNLFKLETLGVDGNPLDDETRERIMRDGTKGLITHVRETADRKTSISSMKILGSES